MLGVDDWDTTPQPIIKPNIWGWMATWVYGETRVHKVPEYTGEREDIKTAKRGHGGRKRIL